MGEVYGGGPRLRFLPVEDIETEVATACGQAHLPVEGRGHQSTYKTFNLQFVHG